MSESDADFGSYLKSIRKLKMTQEELSRRVGRKKMTISLIENGKNGPPGGELLQKIIEALEPLQDTQKYKLLDLSASQRNELPEDMAAYFYASEELRDAIRRAMKSKKANPDWAGIFK